MQRAAMPLLFVALFVLANGCARATELRGRIDGVRDVIEQADRNGAYRCAPRELAVARSQLTFAETELAQGNSSRAEEHFAIAEPNARSAFTRSPVDRCTEGRPPVSGDADGDGVPDSRDLCLVEPEDGDGYLDTDGCPESDNDLDRILDDADRCPNEPEDLEGFQDDDGCPDPDNDSDSILDAADRCPNEPGPESEQGCPPHYEDVELTGNAIRIHQKIHFEFNKATIRPVSFPILNTVAQVLKDYPNLAVEVQGHTDSRGTNAYNMGLSQRRADSVRQYLTEQGIDAARLTARGYGEEQPIEENRTATGRAANRRVEFIRTDPGATPQASPPASP